MNGSYFGEDKPTCVACNRESQTPVNPFLPLLLQKFIGFRKMLAAEESAPGKRRRMSSLQNKVLRSINQVFLGAGKVAPKQKNDPFLFIRYLLDHSICKGVPSDGGMRVSFSC